MCVIKILFTRTKYLNKTIFQVNQLKNVLTILIFQVNVERKEYFRCHLDC